MNHYSRNLGRAFLRFPIVISKCEQIPKSLSRPQEHWANALRTLDLTLAEVIHIRSVLTKAEMEGLTIDANLRDDLERGKVNSTNPFE